MEEERDQYVKVCPCCGGSEIILAYQGSTYGSIAAVQNKLGGCALYHSVCRDCGSVVRSFVKEPENLLKKKDRKPR